MKKIPTAPECILLLVMSAIGLTSLPSETAVGSLQKATYRPTGDEGVITAGLINQSFFNLLRLARTFGDG